MNYFKLWTLCVEKLQQSIGCNLFPYKKFKFKMVNACNKSVWKNVEGNLKTAGNGNNE